MSTTMPIPAALIARDQWVTWCWEGEPNPGTGKRNKVLKNPRTGYNADSTNPKTWASFDVASRAAIARGHAGVGFVFTADDPLIGIDLDGCRDPETGALAEWAREAIVALDSYTEVSPSLTGVKVFVEGDIPKNLKVQHAHGEGTGIEFYRTERYFTVTGMRLPETPAEVRSVNGTLTRLYGHYVERQDDLRRQRREQHVAKRRREAERQPQPIAVPSSLRDRTEAALVRLGTYRVDDYNHWIGVGAALRGSGVAGACELWDDWSRTSARWEEGTCAAKWDALPNDPDGLTTLEKMAHLDDPPDRPPSLVISDGVAYCPQCERKVAKSKWEGWFCGCQRPVLRWPDSAYRPVEQAQTVAPVPTVARSTLVHASRLGAAVEKITWLIPGILGLNALSELFAPGGSGKSLVALDQALCVAQHAPVVYVAAEAAGEQEERVVAWCAHHGLDVGQLYFWPRPLMLKDPASVDAFLAEVLPIRPALIVLDPLAACMEGLEESSTGDMTVAVGALNRIREATGAAVNVVHHTGWTETHERGSSVLRNACRVVVKLSADDTGLITLTCEKANSGKAFEARYFRLVESGPSVTPIPASKATMRNAALTVRHIAILEALSLAQHRAGAIFTQILDTTEQSKSTLNKSLHRLIERGLIAVDGRIYTLTDAGRHELAATTTVTKFASSPAREAGELAVNWHVSYQPGEADSPHQGAEFTPSSPVVHSEFADQGEQGQLPVNWPAAHPRTEGRLPLPNAEFTEFTRACELVHSPVANSGVPEFTEHSASQCASSPEFTTSSPAGSPSQFTSSPSPRFWKRGQGELAKSNGDEPLPDEPPPGWQISQAPRTGRWWATNGKGLGEYHRTRESALAWAWTNTTA